MSPFGSSRVFGLQLVGTTIGLIGGIFSAYAQVPPQAVQSGPVTEFRVSSIPPGTVVYKSLAELPEAARAPLVSAEAAGVSTQKTSDGIPYRTFSVDESATTMIERERDRYIWLSKPGQNGPWPDYVTRSLTGGLKSDAMLIEKAATDGAPLNAAYIFSAPDGGLYLLKEWSYVADGGSVMRILDYCNTKVNEIPATYAVLRGPSGVEVRALKWVTESKSFDLYYKGSRTNDQAYAQMLKFAQSLGN